MSTLPFILIILAAALTNNLAGFGLALVSMPFLIPLLGIKTATLLIALVALTIQISMVWRYRSAFDIRGLWRLIAPSIIGVPVGVLAIDWLNETLLSTGLGIVILLYVAYRWLQRGNFRPFPAASAYFFGFLGGLLGGAYNTSGPPVVLFADSQNWDPDQFKVNLQTYFLANGLIGVSTHFLNGNFTAEVGRYYLLALPVMASGYIISGYLDRFIKPALFRQGVLVLLVILGLRLATAWL